jgi:hypothetical protein
MSVVGSLPEAEHSRLVGIAGGRSSLSFPKIISAHSDGAASASSNSQGAYGL